MGGVSVAGLRPGLGRGGITHSFEVTEVCVWGAGEPAGGIGFIDKVGCRGRAGANGGGEAADEGVEVFDVVAIMFRVSVARVGIRYLAKNRTPGYNRLCSCGGPWNSRDSNDSSRRRREGGLK